MTVLQPGATFLRACKVGFPLLISTGDHPPRSSAPCRARFPRDRRNLHDLAPDRELRELHRGDRRFSGGCSLVRATRLSGAAMSEKPDYKRSEEHTSELQSLMRISYAVFCLKKKNNKNK